MSRRIVLASTSRYRRALLDAWGLTYDAAAPRFAEDHSLPLGVEEMVVAFARGKAESLASDHPDALILGSDQLAELDGHVLTKPGTVNGAIDQLMRLQGQTHRLLTAVALHDPRSGETWEEMTVHSMTMRALTRDLAAAYVAKDAPMDCAGAYKVEATGAALFVSMDGRDHTAIVGLPITAVAALFARAGEDLLARLVDPN